MNVAIDYTQPLTYLKTNCQDPECGAEVTYANTKIVNTPVTPAPQFPGMITHTSVRVCTTH
jgi:hypothetical protein